MEQITEDPKEQSAAKHEEMITNRGSLASSIESTVFSEESPGLRPVSTKITSKKNYAIKKKQQERRLRRAREQKKAEQDFAEARKLEKMWANFQMDQQLVELGMDPKSTAEPYNGADRHPACHGYKMNKRMNAWNPATRSPQFFGYQHVSLRKLGGGSALSAIRSIKTTAQDFEKMAAEHAMLPVSVQRRRQENKVQHWDVYPTAPVNRGLVRQHYKKFGRSYDRQHVIHPSFFSLMLTAEKYDPASLSPVFFGYSMEQREDAQKVVTKVRQDFVADIWTLPHSACPVCVIGKPGCPRCWDFPKGFEPEDYGYEGLNPDPNKYVKPNRPPLHTDLTTHNAILLYRAVNSNFIKLYMKTVPAGPTVEIVLEAGCPVFFLAHLFRANSRHGTENDAFFFIPTEKGFYSIDNIFLPETDVTNGVYSSDLPISMYSLKKNGSIATVLHFTYLNEVTTCMNIKKFLDSNIAVPMEFNAEIIHYLDGIPKEIPGKDNVQKELHRLLNDAEELQVQMTLNDKRWEEQKIQALLRNKYELEKRKYLNNNSEEKRRRNREMEKNRLERRRKKQELKLKNPTGDPQNEEKLQLDPAKKQLQLRLPKPRRRHR